MSVATWSKPHQGDFDDNGAGQKATKEFIHALQERNLGFEIFAEKEIYSDEEAGLE